MTSSFIRYFSYVISSYTQQINRVQSFSLNEAIVNRATEAKMAGLTYKGKRHLPLPKGPYTVGCTDVMTGYSERGCFMRLYYPCTESGILELHEQWPLWAPTKDYIDGLTSVAELPFFISKKLVENTFDKLYIPAIWDSVPLSKGKPHPLIVWSHGLTAFRTTYSANHLELASHGYIVAAVEHRDKSACYTYYLKRTKSPENSFETANNEDECSDAIIEKHSVPLLTKSISSQFFSLRNEQVHQRAEECIRALDVLKDVNDGNPPKNVLDTNCDLSKFQGLFDMSKVALIGHSFGGGTTLMALSKEPRFRVGMTLDPWMMPIHKEEDLPSRLTQPILIISSSRFFDRKSMETLEKIQAQENETKCVTIRKSSHFSQCDIPFVIPNNILTKIARWRSKTDYADKFLHLDIHNRLMMVFLEKHLDVPVDAEFEAFIKNNSSHIIDGITFTPPVPRETLRPYHKATALLTLLFVIMFWYLFW